jgi:leader peptidase (prepilin peptidase)/N-methyltransferase
MSSVLIGAPSDILFLLEISFVLLLGLVLGSFSTMLAHRGNVLVLKPTTPTERKKVKDARSQCPKCNAKLGVRDLVPVFSWLFQKGRCRHCKEPISPIYPAIELSVTLMGLAYYLVHGFDPLIQLFCVVVAGAFLVGLAVFDLRHKLLPNQMILMLAVLGVVFRFIPFHAGSNLEPKLVEFIGGGVLYAVLAFVLGWLMRLILKKQALGMGDVKFFGVAGLWLGISQLGVFCLLSGIFGVVLGLIWQSIKKEKVFPFGPALIASFYVVLLLNGSHLP